MLAPLNYSLVHLSICASVSQQHMLQLHPTHLEQHAAARQPREPRGFAKSGCGISLHGPCCLPAQMPGVCDVQATSHWRVQLLCMPCYKRALLTATSSSHQCWMVTECRSTLIGSYSPSQTIRYFFTPQHAFGYMPLSL